MRLFARKRINLNLEFPMAERPPELEEILRRLAELEERVKELEERDSNLY